MVSVKVLCCWFRFCVVASGFVLSVKVLCWLKKKQGL